MFGSLNSIVTRDDALQTCAACVHAQLLQSCPTLCYSMDNSPPGSSVHGILKARILEWVATPSSTGSSRPRGWIRVSCIAGRFPTIWASREVQWSEVANIFHEIRIRILSQTNIEYFFSHFSQKKIEPESPELQAYSLTTESPEKPDMWKLLKKSAGPYLKPVRASLINFTFYFYILFYILASF